MSTERETLEFDVLIVGGGPAGLAAAIKLRQLAAENNTDISVCVIEKAGALGDHSLAGAVLEPRALDELLPDWRELSSPVQTAVTEDRFLFFTEQKSYKMLTPPQMHNEGNYIISIGQLVRWLGEQAESAGVEIFPGFAAAEVLYDESGAVTGVATGDMGIGRDGVPKANHQPGVALNAKYTVFAEGCRGSLSKQVIDKFNLRDGHCPQTYGIGIKELWEVPESASTPGLVIHSIGWPLSSDTYGGSFLYHLTAGKIAVGFVVGLDYANPYLSPYEEFQRFKHHPTIAAMLQGGKRIAYGARALNEGGYQSVPTLSVPGGLLAGCAAGFLNVPKIKGIHTAMKTGMLAAESIAGALRGSRAGENLSDYDKTVRASWVMDELYRARNIRPGFSRGLYLGLAYAGIDTYLLRGRAPWTFKHKSDHDQLKPAAAFTPIDYPKPDGVLSFSRLDNLSFSGVYHEENQPAHLRLTDTSVAVNVNWKTYAGPESRYCPAGVYEFVDDESGNKTLVINAQNCVHCKTCDIKDPTQNINWTTPEGGGGPSYEMM